MMPQGTLSYVTNLVLATLLLPIPGCAMWGKMLPGYCNLQMGFDQ